MGSFRMRQGSDRISVVGEPLVTGNMTLQPTSSCRRRTIHRSLPSGYTPRRSRTIWSARSGGFGLVGSTRRSDSLWLFTRSGLFLTFVCDKAEIFHPFCARLQGVPRCNRSSAPSCRRTHLRCVQLSFGVVAKTLVNMTQPGAIARRRLSAVP